MPARFNKKTSDEALLKEILTHHSEEAFRELHRRYFSKVYYQCLSYVKDQAIAEDLSQEAFIKLYDRLSRFHGKSSFSTWLYSLVRNVCLDYLRKAGKSATQSMDDYQLPDMPEVEDDELLAIKVEELAVILEQIPPDDKAILIMKYAHDWQIDEIAEHLGASESAIKMRLKRAKQKVKLLYEKQFGIPHPV
ncbi:MAG: RNA polymerase sigma factor [Bacteroidetes bacterium]|nr:MAG: RNA polymerase sigma factor [Bacteroidota bacterium]